jgi:hypothetical protein
MPGKSVTPAVEIMSKGQKLQNGSLDIGLETTLATAKFAMQGTAGLKGSNLTIQFLKNLFYGGNFFSELHTTKVGDLGIRSP